MLDLQHLKTFTVVATTTNFSRAALMLGYSQSTVTYHIKTLERELGARLLSRFKFSRTIGLTDVGCRIFKYAAQIVALAEETKAEVKRKDGEVGRGS